MFIYLIYFVFCIFEKFWTEPPFRTYLLFGYVRSGPERTSLFSASTVPPYNDSYDTGDSQDPEASGLPHSARQTFTKINDVDLPILRIAQAASRMIRHEFVQNLQNV